VTILAAGIAWLVAALIALAARHQLSTVVLGDIAATFGILLPAVAWTAGERGWPVPRQLREALALSAVPVLAVAARVIVTGQWFTRMDGPHGAMTPGGLAAAALVVGALAGAVIAYPASPGVTTFTVLLAALLAAVLGVCLAVAKAHGPAAAVVVAVVAFGLLTVTPTTAGRIVAFSDKRARARGVADGRDDDPVATAVSTAATLLIVWSGVLAAVLGAALVPMAASRSPYAAAAAGCLGLAVLLRAGAARLTAEVVPLLLAGATGLFTLLLAGPGHLGWPSWTAPTGAVAIAAILLVYGFRRLMRRPEVPAVTRPRWLTGFSSTLGGTGAALAIATFGVFGRIVELGHHI
jgi:hypothetical protein